MNTRFGVLCVSLLANLVACTSEPEPTQPIDVGPRDAAADASELEDAALADAFELDVDAGALNDAGGEDAGDSGASDVLRAFPGAGGFGRDATGGRGGEVYKVTNLDDSGPGSFRDAVSAPGRTILFEVAGYIDTLSTIDISANTTIAGQTAFREGGQGITVRRGGAHPGGPLLTSDGNIIVRHIRFRPGRRVEGDCCGDAWLAFETSNLIFDHVSASYSSDEMFDFTGTTDVTIQNSILSEPLSEVSGPAAGGKTVMGANTDRISIYRTLIANSSQRNPLLTPPNGVSTTHEYEYVNCYGFNLGSFGLTTGGNDSGAPIHMNIVGNYWHDAVGTSRRWVQLFGETNSLYFLSDDNFDSRYRTSAGGDVWDDITAITDDYESNFSRPQSTDYQATTAHALPLADGTALIDGSEIWSTLGGEFGASLFRDAADLRVVAQINGNDAPDWSIGPLDESEFGTAYSPVAAMSAVPSDGDGDGIPDAFEMSLGSNPARADQNEDEDGDGYTNLEEYLNSLM